MYIRLSISDFEDIRLRQYGGYVHGYVISLYHYSSAHHHQPQPTSAAHFGSFDRLGYSRIVPVTVRPGRLHRGRPDDADPGLADCLSWSRCTASSTQHPPLRTDVLVSVASLCICPESTGLL